MSAYFTCCRWGQTYTFYKNYKTNMTINSIRKILYWISKILGNINAVSKGKVGKRVARSATVKTTGKVLKVLAEDNSGKHNL